MSISGDFQMMSLDFDSDLPLQAPPSTVPLRRSKRKRDKHIDVPSTSAQHEHPFPGPSGENQYPQPPLPKKQKISLLNGTAEEPSATALPVSRRFYESPSV